LNEILVILITSFIATVILVVVVFLVLGKVKNNKYKKEIEELDIEKNKLVGVPIMSELSKVRELVKTDNLKVKLESWDNNFKLIKDEKIPKISDLIMEADFLINKKDYKTALKRIADIEIELKETKSKSSNLLDEIKIITNSEERNRNIIIKLKIIYRELQNKFERTRKEYDDAEKSIVLQFEVIDKKFQDFEDAMDRNDYVEVEKIVINIEELINEMKTLLEEIPNIILLSKIIIPKKQEEITTLYARMVRDGYPLDYLNIEYNIKEINKKVNIILDKVKMLNLGDSSLELKTIVQYFDDLFNDFDKEKECKSIFQDEIKTFGKRLEKINKIVHDIYIQIDDIKLTYDLTDAEIEKFGMLNQQLEKLNADYKLLKEQGVSKTFAYSKLVSELEGLNNKLVRLQDDLDYQLQSITSMKDDEFRAKEQLTIIQKLLREAKYKVRDYKLPVIPATYYTQMKEAQDAIKEIIKELERKPIVIKILNIRVDTARDLVFKIYNTTNDMIKTAIMAEKSIIYGNRYRSSYDEVNKSLERAEDLFEKGNYKEALDITLNSIELIENGAKDKLITKFMEELNE